MSKLRVAILGATGYTALEVIQILLRHPNVTIDILTSRQESQPHLNEIHPRFSGQLDLHLTTFDADKIRKNADVVFSCLPHAASAETVLTLTDGQTRVIDFSADYRIDQLAVYEEWYKIKHPDPDRVGTVPYGLPEFFADEIKGADLVANPGCYPTAAILGVGPLLNAGLIEAHDLIIDAKSGVSGAGRSPKLATLFSECSESIAAYAYGQHRHSPEMKQVLGKIAGSNVRLIFTPHLLPMDRGILATTYALPATSSSEDQCFQALREFYADKPFVDVVSQLPATKHVSGTNRCHVTVRKIEDRIVVISAIDNLLKGASGAAVQNMNLMFGLDETAGLR